MSSRILKTIIQILLLAVIAIIPFIKVSSLYFPYVSGKVYVFRALVMLALFFWVWLSLKEIKNKKQETRIDFRNILVIALLLFFLAQVLVSFFGIDPAFSFFSSLSRADGVLQYGFWFLYFLFLISVFKKDDDWKILFSVFTFVSFLLAIFAWLGYPPDQELYGNFFGNPAYFAGFLIFSIGFSLLLFERKFFKNRLINNLFLFAAAFFAVTLLFTQIRGALIGLVGGVFLFCLLTILFLRKEKKKLVYFSGIVLLLGIIFFAVLFGLKDSAFIKNVPALSRITAITALQEPGTARERVLVWNIALKAFQEKPIFGWGPENFASAVNKYYDHWVGERETWFDRAHNIPLEILAGGGIFLFAFYLFWIFAAFFLIFKIAKPGSRISASSPSANKFGQSPAEISLPGKQQKILSLILASVFFAYFLQGLFLFDTLAVYLGLFPFLAFLVVASRQTRIDTDKNASLIRIHTDKNPCLSVFTSVFISVVAIFSLFVIYTTVIMPWKANAAALKFYTFTEAGFYKGVRPYLEKSFVIKSPYTYWGVRKEAGWQFLRILEDKVGETASAKDIRAIEEIYDFITPELERFAENRAYDPQIYYILARIYRAGFEKLGRNDLPKAEIILRKALNYSDLRKEYFEELKRVLLLQGKFEEAEKMLQDYVERVAQQNNFDLLRNFRFSNRKPCQSCHTGLDFYDYFPYLTMGHFYFEAEKYELAMEQYERAKETGYNFCRIPAEYSRYMFSAEKTKEYRRIVEMGKTCLEKQGQDADIYFNIAVGYLNLGEKEKAKEFFLKAVELKKEYEEYRPFFVP